MFISKPFFFIVNKDFSLQIMSLAFFSLHLLINIFSTAWLCGAVMHVMPFFIIPAFSFAIEVNLSPKIRMIY